MELLFIYLFIIIITVESAFWCEVKRHTVCFAAAASFYFRFDYVN
jgi:hypothetical protein